MKDFLNLKLFSLFSGGRTASSPARTEIQSAYEELASVIYEKIGEKADLPKLYYELGFVRLELMELQSCCLTGKGKKCLELYNESKCPD